MSLRGFVAGLALAGAVTVAAAAPATADNTTYNWGGLYLGTTSGWAGTDVRGSYVLSANVNRHNVSGDSWIYGGVLGIQHQFGQFVLGVEVNYSGTGFGDDWDASNNGPNASCLGGTATPFTCRARVDSILTIGPRVGFALSNRWLVFATGGYAQGRIDTSVLHRSTGVEVGRSSHSHDGWFAGGGVEYALTPNWSLGLEYQHVDFDTERHFDSRFGACCTVTPETRDRRGEVDIVRFRTTYKFGRRVEAAPLK
jgi:outer membrane immunogenic protein